MGCVVARVQLLTLNRKHTICSDCILLSEYGSGVRFEKKATWGCIVKPFAQFWTTSFSRKLFIFDEFGTVSSFLIEIQNLSKGKFDICEILILLFDFCFLILKFCNTILHTKFLPHLFSLSIFDYEALTITRIKIRIYFDLLLQHLFLCRFFLKR